MAVYTKQETRLSEKAELVPCLPMDSAKTLLLASDKPAFRRLLLPFDRECMDGPDLETALEMTSSAELVLLHVGRDDDLDEEALFTTLRGLQAQTQQAGVKVDSLVEDTAVSLLDYAHQHHIDLILLHDKEVSA
ncbi:MAG TPA: universal stress protein [Chloroflexota bacterium]|nr:universal stress protein [Chloroflexota bacterium]HUM72241.1 universal stress protein [Chloroflexota bacterium]